MGFLKSIGNSVYRGVYNAASDTEQVLQRNAEAKMPYDLVQFYMEKMHSEQNRFLSSLPSNIGAVTHNDYVGGPYYLIWYDRAVIRPDVIAWANIQPSKRKGYITIKQSMLRSQGIASFKGVIPMEGPIKFLTYEEYLRRSEKPWENEI